MYPSHFDHVTAKPGNRVSKVRVMYEYDPAAPGKMVAIQL
jgi:hypothetical protein